MSVGIHSTKTSNILPVPYKIRKTLLDAIKIDKEQLGIHTSQIFIQGPQNYHMSEIDEIKIKDYCAENKMNLYVHSSYLTVGCWKVTKDNINEKKSINAIKCIVDQLKVCDKLNSKGFVVHLSKKTPEQIINSLKIIYPIIKKYKTPFLFEQPAKKADGNLTYETFEKMNNLNNLVKIRFPNFNFGWCVDTCHLWSSGVEINKKNIMSKLISNIDNIKLFHLNGGSDDIFNTGKDKHIIPFSGDDAIFKNSIKKTVEITKKTNLGVITNYSKKNNIDLILEVNRGELKDLKFAIEKLNALM
jgi:endonuclease IV